MHASQSQFFRFVSLFSHSCTCSYIWQLENCQVTANITTVRKDKSEYHAVQVAASDKPLKTTTKQMLGHFKKAGVPPKRIVKEFPVTGDAHVPVGGSLSSSAQACVFLLEQELPYLLLISFRDNLWMWWQTRESIIMVLFPSGLMHASQDW